MAVPHTSGTSLAWANPLQHQSLDPSSQLQLLTTRPQTSQHGLATEVGGQGEGGQVRGHERVPD